MLTTLFNLSLLPLLRAACGFSAAAGLLLVFKPLLTGIVRALLLLLRPHLSKEERRARRAMRDAMMLQNMIATAYGPSHAAELRAMGCRS